MNYFFGTILGDHDVCTMALRYTAQHAEPGYEGGPGSARS
jgi:hypothetical protein